MSEHQKIILAAEKLAVEYEAEGTTSYDHFLIGVLKREIEILCQEKSKLDEILNQLNKLAA